MLTRHFIFLFVAAVLVAGAQTAIAQDRTQDAMQSDIYSKAPSDVQKRKAFLREKWIYEQRAYPSGVIPFDARARAYTQKLAITPVQKGKNNSKLFGYSAWTPIGPAPGKYGGWGFISGRVTALAIDPANPSRIFAGAASGGIWRTMNKGINWTPLTDREASLTTGSIAIDPKNSDIIYVGTGEATYSGYSYYGAGLLKSVDGGNYWQNISYGIPMGATTSRILVSPQNSNIILAALATRGIYRSTDAGATWARVFASRVDDIVFHPINQATIIGVGGDGTGLIRSVDAGRTWQAYGTNFPPQAGRMQIDLCKAQPSIVYASTYNEPGTNGKVYVYKSSDTGVNWTKLAPTVDFKGGQAWYDFHIRCSPTNPLVCFVGTIEIFRTTTGGTTWEDVSRGYSNGPVHVDQHDLRFAPDDPKTVYAGNDGGVYKSTDLGDTWVSLNEGLMLTQFYRLASNPKNSDHMLGGTQDNGTQQTFGQPGWVDAFGGDGGEVCFSATNPNFILGESQNGGLVRSTNGGYAWAGAMDGFTDKEPAVWVAPIINHPKGLQIFYHGRVNFYKTTNTGKAWFATKDSLFGNDQIEQLAISRDTLNPVIYATSNYRVKKSTDDGKTFSDVTPNLPNKSITSIYVYPNADSANIVFVTQSGFGGDKVWRRNSNNTAWLSLQGNLPDTPLNDIFVHPDAPDSWYAVASDIGVFVTENGGKTWAELSTGLPNTVVMHLDYNPLTKKLRAATHGRSVWEMVITPRPAEPPKNLTASAEDRSATVVWEASPSTGIKHYSVYRGTKTGTGDHVANVPSLSLVDAGLQNEVTYYYRIRTVTANDSSAFSAEVYATPRVWQGCYGTVMQLSGGYLLLPNAFTSYDALTIEGWLWWKSFASWSRFFDFGERDRAYLVANEAKTGTLVFHVYDSSKVARSISYQGALTLDRPVHVAAVSGPDGMKLYLNGRLIDSHPYSGSVNVVKATRVNNYIGRSNWSENLNFSGLMDEIRIWRNERTSDQIRTDYNRRLRPNEIADTNLVAYYDFENVDDTTVFDLSSKKNHAKIKGSVDFLFCSTPMSVSRSNDLSFVLGQNHPNPVTSVTGSLTTIDFTLDRAATVTLEVYNALGQVVASLVRDELRDAGSYSERLDVMPLQSGVYMYTLRTGDKCATRKLSIVK